MSDYSGNTLSSLNPSTPAGGVDPVADLDDAIQQIKRVLLNNGAGGLLGIIHPVGCIYVSTVDNDPSTTLGFGVWLKLEEVVLVAHNASSFVFGTVTANKSGADVGANFSPITVEELPAHSHDININNENGIDADGYGQGVGYSVTRPTNPPRVDIATESVGGGVARSNLQSSRTVYMWERTA